MWMRFIFFVTNRTTTTIVFLIKEGLIDVPRLAAKKRQKNSFRDIHSLTSQLTPLVKMSRFESGFVPVRNDHDVLQGSKQRNGLLIEIYRMCTVAHPKPHWSKFVFLLCDKYSSRPDAFFRSNRRDATRLNSQLNRYPPRGLNTQLFRTGLCNA